MTGRRLPLSWGKRIHHNRRNTYTLLDAAALSTTSPLNINEWQPDFTCLSFYKIFGFPNLGALIVRKTMSRLTERRKYFAGGTVDMVISPSDEAWHAKKLPLHQQLEEGTVPFTSIFALDHALDTHTRLYGSMSAISSHTCFLVKYCYDSLVKLLHSNGRHLCIIYNEPGAIYDDPNLQGGTIAFNVFRADGLVVGYNQVEQAADAHYIYVRSGALCNPGGLTTYLGWKAKDMRKAYSFGHRCSKPTEIANGKATGVVRVSFGACSIKADVDVLIEFLKKTYLDTQNPQTHSENAFTEMAGVSGATTTHCPPMVTTQGVVDLYPEDQHAELPEPAEPAPVTGRMNRLKLTFSLRSRLSNLSLRYRE
jgi:molybdenum cofactor sulfurtransferase